MFLLVDRIRIRAKITDPDIRCPKTYPSGTMLLTLEWGFSKRKEHFIFWGFLLHIRVFRLPSPSHIEYGVSEKKNLL